MKKINNRNLILIKFFILTLLIFLVFKNQAIWEKFLHFLFPDSKPVLHIANSVWGFAKAHIFLVLISTFFSFIIGFSLAVFATSKYGNEIQVQILNIGSSGQTFPPVALLFLIIPFVGFGVKPAIITLFIFGIFPILQNSISGFNSINLSTIESAKALGMTDFQIFWKVKLPLSLPIIMEGIRISTIVNVGTATIGATAGAGGFGSPIISGLINNNNAFIMEGAIGSILIAFYFDYSLRLIENWFST